MFSYEERIKAVELLVQYDMSYATVVRELGYPQKPPLGSGTKNTHRRENSTRILRRNQNLLLKKNKGQLIIILNMVNTYPRQ